MDVEGWLARAAAARPHGTAIETPRESWSYERLHLAARFAAGELTTRGAGPGARVAIALPAGLDFAQALHACLLLGAVAVPIDPRLTDVERETIAAGCAVRVEEPMGDAPTATASAPEPTSVSPAAPVALRHDRDALAPPAAPWHHQDAPSPHVATRHDLDATAVIIHTSGTTSAPRPVELTYGNILWSALGSAVALGVDPRERWLCALPLSHVGGLSILLRSAIYATTAVVHERFETDRVLHALREERITLVSLVATTLARLLDSGLADPPALRCALTGGGPVPAALVKRARRANVPVGLTYGLSETCSQVTTTPAAEIHASGLDVGDGERGEIFSLNAGPPLFCTRVQINSYKEILVQGPTVAPGALSPDGWLHTGDLGALDARGRLLVTGRKADTIVSGGENVAPAEVEAVLETHPGVLEAAVLGRSDPQWGEAVTAIVLPRPGARLDAEQLRAHCASALAPYKVPKEFTLRAEPLPRTRSGKLLRRELR
jgi:o-succinylbenzoate---CoA ligase